MTDFLSPDEIERLFERASEGALPMEAPSAAKESGKRARWLRTVDFSRPTKFSTDQERRLRRLLDGFCAAAAQRVQAEHRLPIEFEVLDLQQLTWGNAFRLIPDKAAYCTLETAPHEGRMLLSAELPLLVTALEGLLGGNSSDALGPRELTDIDLILVRRLMRTCVDVLSGGFFDLTEMTLDLLEVSTLAETVQVAPSSEPTLLVTLEARLHKVSCTVALLVPYAAIAPVAIALSQREDEVVHRDAVQAQAVRESVEHVDLTVRAEVADTILSLEDLLALRPGDTIRLDGEAGGEITLFADRTPVHHARAGRHGGKRAVQVLRPVEAPR